MKTAFKFKALWLFAALAGGLTRHVQAQQLITNGGFEAGFSGWTRSDQVGSEGTFFVQTGTTSPVNGFTVPAPPAGTQAALTDAQAPGSHVLYQDFTVPTGILGGTVGFSLFINNGATDIISGAPVFFSPATLDFATPTLNQQARVDILAASAAPFSAAAGDVLQNLFQTSPGNPGVSGYNNFSINISSLLVARQGQTLRLRFAEADNVAFLNLGVDRVSLQAASIPEPSSLLIAAGGLLPLAWGVGRRRRAPWA